MVWVNSNRVDKLIERFFDSMNKKENQSFLKGNLKNLPEIKEIKDIYKHEKNLIIVEDPIELTEVIRIFKDNIICLSKKL